MNGIINNAAGILYSIVPCLVLDFRTAGEMQRQLCKSARPLWDRSLRILVHPIPLTFRERRAILQVLEDVGPVEVFRQDPVSAIVPRSFVAIPHLPDTAC